MKKILVILTAIALMAVSTVTTFAAVSPTAPVNNKVTVDADKGGSASSSVTVIQKGDEVTLTAKEDGGDFDGWDITGDYEIISGDLNSKVIVIRAKSDIKAHAKFIPNATGTPSSDKPATPSQGKGNPSDTSPTTGNESVVFFGIAALALLPIALYAKKRLAKSE